MDSEESAALRGVWCSYLDSLKAAGGELFRASTPSDGVAAAEGLRHLSRLTRLGLLAQVEYSDPDFPVLARYVDEVTKFGCDNPDTIYMRALINSAHRYRIVGRRNSIDYLSFITTKPGAEGRQFQIDHLDSKRLQVAPDGSFEIVISPEASGDNWLKMDAETTAVSVRQTYLDRKREVPADLRIERVGESAAPPALSLEGIKAKLQRASDYTLYCARTFTDWTESYLAHPNQLPPADQEKCLRAGGDPNIYFYRSFWNLRPDEALVVHIPRIPECDTWNLQLDNYWQESMDYRYHSSNINKYSAKHDPDGGVTAIIAHQDPGLPNWLDTAGHSLGHFAMRHIRASEHPDPTTRVCKFADLATVVRQGQER